MCRLSWRWEPGVLVVVFVVFAVLFSSLLTCLRQTALMQPAAPQFIGEDTEVHLFVPANSSDPVKELLHRHRMTPE